MLTDSQYADLVFITIGSHPQQYTQLRGAQITQDPNNIDLSLAFSQYRWKFFFLFYWEDGTQSFYPLKVLSFEVERCP